ncbi:hypothetical protein TSMEX_010245 [Taenia solium]|eukprot:TsM_000167700 transcript=TsM_000167700 gene=TsM_000167700
MYNIQGATPPPLVFPPDKRLAPPNHIYFVYKNNRLVKRYLCLSLARRWRYQPSSPIPFYAVQPTLCCYPGSRACAYCQFAFTLESFV